MQRLCLVLLVLVCWYYASVNYIRYKFHRCEHFLDFVGQELCTGYSIGPHALLTAQHCYAPSVPLLVDGQVASMYRAFSDGADHLIVLVDVRFPDYLPVRPHTPEPTEFVYTWGNPVHDDFYDQYREGYTSGTYYDAKRNRRYTLFVLPIVPGDSGSLIVDRYGRLVGMVS